MKLGLTYTLGKSLYVPITCRCNSLTLPQTRGPGFVLPGEVASTLQRVRQLELTSATGTTWTADPLPSVPMISNEDQIMPAAEELIEEIETIDPAEFESLVFGGEGEPTLRLNSVIKIARKIRNAWKNTRLTTNGLVDEPTTTAEELNKAGIKCVSVSLPTYDVDQYDELMKPHLLSSSTTRNQQHDQPAKRALDTVCDFILASKEAGLQVELTAVARPDVDQRRTQDLANTLVGSNNIRWRPYFA